MKTRSSVQVSINPDGVITETTVSATGFGTHTRWIHPDDDKPIRRHASPPPVPLDPWSSFSSESTSDSGETFSDVESDFSSCSSSSFVPLQIHHSLNSLLEQPGDNFLNENEEEEGRRYQEQMSVLQDLEVFQKHRFQAYSDEHQRRLMLENTTPSLPPSQGVQNSQNVPFGPSDTVVIDHSRWVAPSRAQSTYSATSSTLSRQPTEIL